MLPEPTTERRNGICVWGWGCFVCLSLNCSNRIAMRFFSNVLCVTESFDCKSLKKTTSDSFVLALSVARLRNSVLIDFNMKLRFCDNLIYAVFLCNRKSVISDRNGIETNSNRYTLSASCCHVEPCWLSRRYPDFQSKGRGFEPRAYNNAFILIEKCTYALLRAKNYKRKHCGERWFLFNFPLVTLITEHLVSSDRHKMPLLLLLWSSKTLSKISSLIFPFSVFSIALQNALLG